MRLLDIKLEGSFAIDAKIFSILNQSLTKNDLWLNFWSYMNHNNENWLNVVFFLALGIWLTKMQKPKIKFLIASWVILQICFLAKIILSKLIIIHRLSPSASLEFMNIQEIFNSENFKVYASQSFPSGHAFVAFFWMFFLIKMAENSSEKIFIFFSCFVIGCARIFSGAHWPSDVLVSALIAYLIYLTTKKYHEKKFLKRV